VNQERQLQHTSVQKTWTDSLVASVDMQEQNKTRLGPMMHAQICGQVSISNARMLVEIKACPLTYHGANPRLVSSSSRLPQPSQLIRLGDDVTMPPTLVECNLSSSCLLLSPIPSLYWHPQSSSSTYRRLLSTNFVYDCTSTELLSICAIPTLQPSPSECDTVPLARASGTLR